jgi:hypothetical protein
MRVGRRMRAAAKFDFWKKPSGAVGFPVFSGNTAPRLAWDHK